MAALDRDRKMIAILIATRITDTLQDLGYNNKILEWTFNLLVDALMEEDESSLPHLLRELDAIHGIDEDAEFLQEEQADIEHHELMKNARH